MFISGKIITVQELAKMGLDCPMCGSKKFHCCYHDHQINDSYICERCGIRWNEDLPKESKTNWKKWVKEVLYYRKNQPLKKGMYAGIPAGGFVWVLHKVGDYKPVLDSRSADAIDYKKFGRNKENVKIAEQTEVETGI